MSRIAAAVAPAQRVGHVQLKIPGVVSPGRLAGIGAGGDHQRLRHRSACAVMDVSRERVAAISPAGQEMGKVQTVARREVRSCV